MAQVINTNSLSLITQNNINKNQSALSTSIERLSSGLRINSAKDDAAGQAIANRFTSNINGLTQAARNANDGISAAQTTEGALSEINNNLQRVRELTVQSQNGTNSQSDLDSIQDEIKSRLDEIDRVSGQTQFNGVNVLAKDGSMKIQVGANDGQTITIDLKKIDSSTLGLNGFNVNGTGNVANKAATVSNLTAAGATETTAGSGLYNLKTTNSAVTADQALSKLATGDTVVVTDGAANATTYTYDAAKGNFSYSASVAGGTAGAGAATFGDSLKPDTGTVSGTYTAKSGTTDSVNFEADNNGNITIGGQKAYLDGSGNLTTSNADGQTSQASLNSLFKASSVAGAAEAATAGDAYNATVSIGGTDYSFNNTDGDVTYTASISKSEVQAQVAAADTAATAAGTPKSAVVNYASGVLTGSVSFDGTTAGKSSDVYTDASGNFTDVKEFTTQYKVDKDTGAVTVNSNIKADGTVDNSSSNPFAKTVGASVNVTAAGKITTDATSAGSVTSDPLAALDDAISSIDKFRSSLGAIQNRLDSAVTNLNNTTTNLSEAQSRIQDADYAVEVSNMSKAQIVQQAGNSVLAKANQVPQQVLSLLQG